MVDVLRKSLHLTKPSTAPASSLPHGVVKRRVYLSPRERVHSSAIRHNMSVLGAPPAALRQTSPDTIRSQLAFGGFHVEFEEPETTEDNAPTSPIGPWMNQGDGVLRQVAATASSPRSRLLSLSVDPGGPKDPRRPKTSVKVVPPQRKKPTPSKKKQPSRPTSSASSVDPTTLDL
ncbi:hypothetical protein B5M09_000378 [Aphanomyces astaci]|nr:hypothetical protein B5M09_000378 [Aphanomyces astaci]